MVKFLPDAFKEPVIADRTLDALAIFTWMCLAGWGIASTLTGIPSITNASTPLYEVLWGGSVGICALVAAAAAASTFITSPNVSVRVRKKRIESWSVSILAGFIAVYPITVGSAALAGDTDRIATFFVALSFLGFPTWRVRHLYYRIRKLRDIGSAKQNGTLGQ